MSAQRSRVSLSLGSGVGTSRSLAGRGAASPRAERWTGSVGGVESDPRPRRDVKPAEVVRAERVLGAVASSWRPVASRIGNERGRWLVDLEGGDSVFVKAPYHEASAEWLRIEALVYQGVAGDFLPRLIAWDGEILILEDLSGELWPPPWTPESIEAVRVSLNELAGVKPPPGLPSLENLRPLFVDSGWPAVAADPQAFLSVGLCSAHWLEAALPVLIAAAESIELRGDSLVHVDIRSDNLCIRGGRALFIDWNWASVGDPILDLAEWLPSLEAEGGPSPEEMLPGERGASYAASLAGLWCARTGMPAPPDLPRLREMQLLQARPALAWAARVLGLPPPG